jgi:hypothetical protein
VDVPVGTVCTYDVACQSGTRSLSLLCGEYSWEMAPGQLCTQSYDSCPDTDYYCDTEWLMPLGTNPPAPCPSTRPVDGEKCFSGGFGGVWPNCGYLCDDNATWTVAACEAPMPGPNPDGVWKLDGACK